MTAADVMDDAAACMNDVSQTFFTDTVLLPYLKIAWQELREVCEENNVEVTNNVSSAVTLQVGQIDIGGQTGPPLPQNIVNPQTLWERLSGTTSDYTQMNKLEVLPKTNLLTNELIYWIWEQQIIKFIGANAIREVKIDYVSNGFPDIESANSIIQLINAKTALAYRTAGLAARYIGENSTRADELDADAVIAMERALNITVKGRQSIATRRRPFRASYHNRGF